MLYAIKSLIKLSLLVGVLAVALVMTMPTLSHAQARTGASGIDNESLRQANCTSTVRRLETLVRELEEFAEELQACNDAGQVYNGTNCVELARIEHEWVPDANNPLQLVFRDNGTEVGRVNVIRGRDGEDASCPDPDDPDEPPVDPPVGPRDCTAPWGATVAHGDSVTAYETSTVPAEESCNDERRTCNDGVLSGTFQNRTCEVEDPPVEPTCRWVGPVPYGTQRGNIHAYIDDNCGAIYPVPCEGCTPFRAQTCDPSSPCSGPSELTCLLNQRSCNARGGQATVWDRYQCVCR